jgi:squalene-hopene/tetraprenyl-beta-curcumene cyclase
VCQVIAIPAAGVALGTTGFFRRPSRFPDWAWQDATDGRRFRSQGDLGTTLLVTLAILRNGDRVGWSAVAQSLKCLESCIRSDGGIYTDGGQLANYETCMAILCLQNVNADHRYNAVLKNAMTFVRRSQYNETHGVHCSDLHFGGLGCGPHHNPDIFNTSLLLDVLKGSGASPSDQAVQDAIVFVSRCQNFLNDENVTPFSTQSADGGFYYTCAAGGVSPPGAMFDGHLLSCGTMTYSGLKCFVDAAIDSGDPRMRAAIAWIRRNYNVANNPGLGNAGLYHYYYACAQALDALGVDRIEDSTGRMHDWRKELTAELIRRQQRDGTWRNENGCWMEDDPKLTTAYALLALSYCQSTGQQAVRDLRGDLAPPLRI